MNEGDKIRKLTSHPYSPLRYGVVSKVLVATLIKKNNNWGISIGSYKSIAKTATRQCRCTKLTLARATIAREEWMLIGRANCSNSRSIVIG